MELPNSVWSPQAAEEKRQWRLQLQKQKACLSVVAQATIPETPGFVVATNTGALYLWINRGESGDSNHSQPLSVHAKVEAEEGETKREDEYSSQGCVKNAHVGPIHCLLATKAYCFSAGSDSKIRGWTWESLQNVSSGKASVEPALTISTLPTLWIGKHFSILDMKYDQLNSILYAACSDGAVRGWSVNTLQEIQSFLVSTSSAVNCIVLRPHHNHMLCGLENGGVELWDLATIKLCKQIVVPNLANTRNRSYITCMDIYSSGDWAVVGGSDSCLSVYHIDTGSKSIIMPMAGIPLFCSILNGTILSGGTDGHIYFWECNGNLRSKLKTPLQFIYSIGLYNTGGSTFEMTVGGNGCNIYSYSNFFYRSGKYVCY